MYKSGFYLLSPLAAVSLRNDTYNKALYENILNNVTKVVVITNNGLAYKGCQQRTVTEHPQPLKQEKTHCQPTRIERINIRARLKFLWVNIRTNRIKKVSPVAPSDL